MGLRTAVRSVQDPLGLCFRIGRNDHSTLLLRLEEGDYPCLSGAVLDPSYEDVHEDLRRELRAKRYEAVLDPHVLELATPAGFERPRLQRLAWSGRRMHKPSDLAGGGGLELADTLAKHVVEKGYTGVVAPSHYIEDPADPWFAVDRELVSRLRRYLDAMGGAEVPIYYLLAIPGKLLRDARRRGKLIEELGGLDVDGLWLRVSPFGTDAGAVALRRYIEGCRDLHKLGLPLVADRVGSAGLPLLAFGAVGGIVSGMTVGGKFEAKRLHRQPKPDAKKFFSVPRVYVEAIGAFLSRKQATAFFAPQNRTQARFGCRDRKCCRRGVADMIEDPRRHYFHTRVREVAELGDAPQTVRPHIYMDDHLRPASDKAIRAAEIDSSLMRVRKQLDGWRGALGKMQEAGGPQSFARVPRGRRIRRPRVRSSA